MQGDKFCLSHTFSYNLSHTSSYPPSGRPPNRRQDRSHPPCLPSQANGEGERTVVGLPLTSQACRQAYHLPLPLTH